ncbi:MAG: hypothetical protein HY000_33040, partial [Planctomycetes bacterium]|nr:hypothetical protein [Planctomycetota bacterium]
MNFSLPRDVAYFPDATGESNSGVINVAGAFSLSFDGLAPIVLTGAGGTLLVDASAIPATSTLTVADDAIANNGVSQVMGDGGVETTTFGAGAGNDTINVIGTGGNSIVQVNAGQGDDTITLQGSGASSAVQLNGQDGFDGIGIYGAGPGKTEAHAES